MTALTSRRPPLTCAAAILLTTLVLAAAAYGSAETGTFGPDTSTITDTVDTSGNCLAQFGTGTLAGTQTVTGRFTENGPPTYGFRAHGTARYSYRIDFTGGVYALAGGVEHFDEQFAGSGTNTNAEAVQESGTVFSADGQRLVDVAIHSISQLVFNDANGNRRPDPGEISANVNRFRLTCH